MKCHLVVEGSADVELIERLLADLPLVDAPRVVASGGKTGCIARARSILAVKREPVAVIVDADTTESRSVEELRAYFDSEMRAVATSAKWQVFVVRPEIEVLLFLVPAAIERFFGIPLNSEQRVRAEYTPKMILDELARQTHKAGESRVQLIQGLTEDELAVLRHHEDIAEIRSFVVSVAGAMLAAST